MRSALSVAISLALAQTAVARDTAAPEPDAAATGGIEEIVVTAQKREEKLQDVPIAISAFSGEQLEDRNIRNVYDLSAQAPNVLISRSPGNQTAAQISIRGGVQINPALTWDPNVGMYLDGVYIGKTQGSVFEVVDLERVEVLRGPQGTLYGRNTQSGAINFITRKPSGKLSGTASVEFGNYNALLAKASLDLPRFGIASVGLAVQTDNRDGWVDVRETTAPAIPGVVGARSTDELYDHASDAARLALNLAFSDSFEADYRFDYTNVDQSSAYNQLVRANVAPLLGPGFGDLVQGILDNYIVTSHRGETAEIDGPSFEKMDLTGHGLTMTWDATESLQLKSITAYREMDWDDGLDLDGSPLALAHTQRLSDYDQFSQELQAVGDAGRWNYVAGLYYFEDDGYTKNPQHFFFGGFNFDSQYGFTTEAEAAYGQVDFHATDALTLTAGLRYTREKKTIDRTLGVSASPTDPFVPLIPAHTGAEDTFSDTTPLLNIAYRVNDAINLYARYAEGFKSGGFNGEYGRVPGPGEDYFAVVAANVAETQTPFKPEKQKSYELGLKSTFADDRVQLNVAAFQNKTDDLQLSIFIAEGAAASVVRNAGKATVQGFEVEGIWQPVDSFRLQGSYGYLDAKYDEFIDGGVDVSDNRAFVHAPRNTWNLSADWRIAETSWGVLRAFADASYVDEHYLYPYQLASSGPQYNPAAAIAGDTKIDDVTLVNARLTLAEIPFGAAQGEVSVWGRNLTDEEHIANYIDFGPGFGSMTPAYYLDPRTYGMTLQVRF
jgi:iron complex outermembrane receptor protein